MNFWCFPWEHMCIAEGNADKANTFKDNKLPQGESRLWWSLIHTIVKEKGKKPYRNVNNMVIDEMRFKERKCIDEFRLSSSDELIESLRLTNYFPIKIYLAYVSTICIECLSRIIYWRPRTWWLRRSDIFYVYTWACFNR